MAKLKRVLGFKSILLLSINAILGTGIFFLPSIGAKIAGPASIVSWIIMSIIAILISMYFADLVSWFPKSGGIYEYVKRAFGKNFYSFLIGWIGWIAANITISMLIVGSLYYLLPSASVFTYVFLAILIVLFFNMISYIGMKESTILLLIFGISTLVALFIIIFPWIFTIDLSNFTPFFVFPYYSIIVAIFYISETFIGWESITFFSEEVKDSKKVLPKAIVLSTVIITIIALLVVITLLGNINWSIIGNVKVPFIYFVKKMMGEGFAKIYSIFVFVPLIGTAAGWVVSTPRLLYAMARDNLFILKAKKIHKKFRTPYISIFYQTIVSVIVTLICIGSYKFLLSFLLPLAIMIYSVVLYAYIIIRNRKKNLKSNALFPDYGPYAIIAFNAIILSIWTIYTENSLFIILLAVIFVIAGLPAYIGVKLQTDKKFIEKWFDRMSFLFSLYFPLVFFRDKQKKKMLKLLKLRNDDIVLDYGCGIGLLTEEMVKKVRDGRIVALEISKKQLSRTIKRIESKFDFPNVIFVKSSSGAPFRKNTFDKIGSVLAINYFVNPEKEIKNLYDVLKKGGRAVFLSARAPFLSIHPFLLRDSLITAVFKRAGFRKIRIFTEKRFLRVFKYIVADK